VLINFTDRQTGQTRQLTIAGYFHQRYNVQLQHNNLPIVEMTKEGVYYPMEVLHLVGLQRYPWKLDESQTSKMIEVAASRPAERLRAIEANKKELDHTNDPILNFIRCED